jgi:hypothetical protein
MNSRSQINYGEIHWKIFSFAYQENKMKGKYPVIAIVMIGIIAAVLACNLSSDSAIEEAIAQTETARPRPASTLIPIPTQKPTNPPEPTHTPDTQPPVTQLSMLEAILSASELDAGEGYFRRAIIELSPSEMEASCAIDCAGKQYQSIDDDFFWLKIELDRAESDEAANNIAKDDPFGGTIITSTDISGFQDMGLWPDNAWMSEVNPELYQASASYEAIVIRIYLITTEPWDDEESAGFILRFAMAMQVTNLIEEQAD